jgi:hypothetical protein
MTRHRLVRCQAAALLTEVSRRHVGGKARVMRTNPVDAAGATPPWLGRSNSQHPAVQWRLRLPGGRWLDWWLEVEQGANGVLAHLSALPSWHPSSVLPSRLSRLALEAWTAHELAVLGRGAESADYPRVTNL